MQDFELFRVKAFAPKQSDLFAPAGSFNPSVVLVDAIHRTPSVERKQGYTWHIGNVTRIDPQGLYFRLGRTTISTRPQFDTATHSFVDVDFESAPYTHVFCDTALEFCAVAPQRELAPQAMNIARQLEALLNATVFESTGRRSDDIGAHRFEVTQINDPSEFLELIQTAYAIQRFAVTFSLPNAWDVEDDIQKPFERWVKASNATQGRAQISGESLDKEAVEAVARSAAASGNDASIKIKRTKKSKAVTRKMRGNPAAIKTADETGDNDKRRSILTEIRDFYASIRGTTRKQ